MAHKVEELSKFLVNVPEDATVVTPSGRKVFVFSAAEREILHHFIQTRYSLRDTSTRLGISTRAVSSALYGTTKGLGILGKLKLYHEAKRSLQDGSNSRSENREVGALDYQEARR